jgi:hypothetical protein
MISPIVKIGDRWARNISLAFQEWADKTRIEGRSNTPIVRFDPTPYIELAFFEAGEAQLATLGKLLGIGVKFDLKSPEAIAWCKKYAAKEIKYIDNATKQTIRQIVLRGFEEGLTSQQQSRLIREHIGLLPQHVQAVANYRKALGDIDPVLADRLEEKYRKKLLVWRANNIGLTEGHIASNQGAYESTKGAVKRGVLDPDEWEEYRIVTRDKRLCHVCESTAGEARQLPDGVYASTGSVIAWVHNMCRCTSGLRRK